MSVLVIVYSFSVYSGSCFCFSKMVVISLILVLFEMLSRFGLVSGFLNSVCIMVLDSVSVVLISNIVSVWGR